MLNAGVLSFQEFAMQEPLPLATIQAAVLDFLRHRDDVVVFGAQAVNAWVNEPRMTQGIDLMSSRASELATEICTLLSEQFSIAVRVREVKAGVGFRIYQLQKGGNRHLVDIRSVDVLPLAERIEDVLVIAPTALLAQKVIAYRRRQGKPKAGTDWRDIAMLLLAFPALKASPELVAAELIKFDAEPEILELWQTLVQQEILPADDDDF